MVITEKGKFKYSGNVDMYYEMRDPTGEFDTSSVDDIRKKISEESNIDINKIFLLRIKLREYRATITSTEEELNISNDGVSDEIEM